MDKLEKIIRTRLGQTEFEKIINIFDINGYFCGEIKQDRFEHKRFDMSPSCFDTYFEMNIKNNKLLELFEDYIKWSKFDYIYVSFWKGCGDIHYRYIGDDNRFIDIGGYGTINIIRKIIEEDFFRARPHKPYSIFRHNYDFKLKEYFIIKNKNYIREQKLKRITNDKNL